MTDVRKTLTEAGYIVIGLGVMGFQQAQVRRREMQARLESTASCAADRARDARNRVEGLAGEVSHRIEPIVDPGRITERLNDLPERVNKAVEPVYQRVRELVRPAA